jgi:hypothetical protein
MVQPSRYNRLMISKSLVWCWWDYYCDSDISQHCGNDAWWTQNRCQVGSPSHFADLANFKLIFVRLHGCVRILPSSLVKFNVQASARQLQPPQPPFPKAITSESAYHDCHPSALGPTHHVYTPPEFQSRSKLVIEK